MKFLVQEHVVQDNDMLKKRTIQMLMGFRITNKSLMLLSVSLLLFFPFSSVYAANIDFSTMLYAIQENSGPIIRFVVATAYVIGISMIFSGILALKKAGQSSYMQQQSHGGIGGPLLRLLLGVFLIYLPSAIDVGVWTLWGHTAFGSSAESFMEYQPQGDDPFLAAKEGAIALIRIVGYVSFVRGFLIISRGTYQGAQPGNFGKGLIHIIGGILAINIVETLRILSNTFGIT